MSVDPESYADVVISGALAVALLDVVEYARLRTADAEVVARLELDAMADALDVEIRDAGPVVRTVDRDPVNITYHAPGGGAPTMDEAARNLGSIMSRALHGTSFLR